MSVKVGSTIGIDYSPDAGKPKYPPRRKGCYPEDPKHPDFPHNEPHYAGWDFTLAEIDRRERRQSKLTVNPSDNAVSSSLAAAQADSIESLKLYTIRRLQELGLDVYGLRVALSDYVDV